MHKRLSLKGVAGFAVCPAPQRPLLAAYVPEAKGQPGFIALYDYTAIGASGDAPPPLCRKSFYRVRALLAGRLGGGRARAWREAGAACAAAGVALAAGRCPPRPALPPRPLPGRRPTRPS